MAHWLVKSEPETFSWDDLVKTGAKGEPWTGVRNHAAKLNLMAMKKGDRRSIIIPAAIGRSSASPR